MKITIIGWYGTETLGDRAIFAGLVYLLSQVHSSLEIKIGCLGVLLTQRSIAEDLSFLKECSNNAIKSISLFDSRKKKELENSIKWCDWVVIGGGPLMELSEMYMLKYAFEYGKSHHKKNVIGGCGLGPFLTEEMEKVAFSILENSDCILFRDEKSKFIYRNDWRGKHDCCGAIDPAVFAAYIFKKNHGNEIKNNNYIAANFRVASSEYKGNESEDLDTKFLKILSQLKDLSDDDILLVPMHYFEIGGDDRIILNKLKRLSEKENIKVCNRPLSLVDTMDVFFNANICLGMRYHSIVLQTLLNGKNFILDYTDPQKGKTMNFLKQLGVFEKYRGRYCSLVSDNGSFDFKKGVERIVISDDLIRKYECCYIDSFKAISR